MFGWDDAIMAGVGGLTGLLTNMKPKKVTTTTDSRNETDMLAGPEYDPQTLAFRNSIMNRYLDQAGMDDTPYWNSYAQNQFQNLDADAANEGSAIDAYMNSRGLGRTTAGSTAMAGVMNKNRMAKAGITASIPMLADQRKREMSTQMSQFLASLPIAQRTKGTQTGHQTSEQVTPADPLGGLFGGLASGLSMIYGSKGGGLFGGGTSKTPSSFASSSGMPSVAQSFANYGKPYIPGS